MIVVIGTFTKFLLSSDYLPLAHDQKLMERMQCIKGMQHFYKYLWLCNKPGHKKAQCYKNKPKKKKNHSGEKANKTSGEITLCAFVNDDIISNSDEMVVNEAITVSVEKSTVQSDIISNFMESLVCDATTAGIGESFWSSEFIQNVNESNALNTCTSENCSFTQIKFCFDSGATQHMVNDKRYFDTLEEIDELSISVAKKNHTIQRNNEATLKLKHFMKVMRHRRQWRMFYW